MSRPRFHPRASYIHASSYGLLPFQFLQFDDQRKIVVNDVGEYLYVDNADFEDFVGHKLDPASNVYLNLKGKHFLFDSNSVAPFELLSLKYRSKKSFLAGFTKLHIFVVSLRCEHSCHYCQVSRVSTNRARYDMTAETAVRALDLVFRSPAVDIKIEFQGGEPLLNFERIVQIVQQAEERAAATGKNIQFVITTNLALSTEEILKYCLEHNIVISTSLDGPAFIHNANRPRPGNNSYELTIQNLQKAREILGLNKVAAIMTATRLSLSHPREIIDEYVSHGFQSIFLRALSPYGFAVRTMKSIGYSIDDFLLFYKQALDYVIELNLEGANLVETYAQILLTRMLTPFTTGYVDLQSPAGAGIGVAV